MRKGATAHDLAWKHSPQLIIAGYGLVHRSPYMSPSYKKRLPEGVCLWCKAMGSRRWLGKIQLVDPAADNSYFIRFLHGAGPLRVRLDDDYSTEVPTTRPGSCCLQRHDKGDVDKAVFRNPDTAGIPMKLDRELDFALAFLRVLHCFS